MRPAIFLGTSGADRSLKDPLAMSHIEPDPEYDFTPPKSESPQKRGRQCGECGMKFEYGTAYGYCCPNSNCPTGWNYR